MISQFFILTPRGDTVVSKDYRGDCPRGTADIFFRKLKSFGNDPPPIFSIEMVHFIHIKRSTLHFVCTTKFNVSPTMTIELLTRIANLCKDYCGVLTEESIRLNFVLIYELLDEVIDFGYGQLTSTESLKNFVYNNPIAVEGLASDSKGFRRMSAEDGAGRKQKRSAPSSAPNKPISLRLSDQRDHKNEIFIDLLERLTVLFGANGNVLRAEIDGCIQMKSFLQGSPELHIGLNEDLQIGRKGGISYGVILDDCNFHECVKDEEFESNRALVLRPPDGEFTLMNYRISGNPNQALPFRVALTFEDSSDHGRTDVVVRLDCDIPPKSFGSNILVRVPLPKATSSCSYELGAPAQSVEYKKDEKVAIWKLTKANGGLSYYCRLKIMTPEEEARSVQADIGPISLDFEVPMYVCSGLSIRFLRVVERGRNYSPFRWVRYITHSDSYVTRC
eukprot:m.47741 g.47741  ORF g.47741 m.47741 type:complete len:447 (-) comp15235_c0_seq1:217-1557(-)